MTITERLLKVLSNAIGRNVTLEEVQNTNLIETFGLSSVDALELLIHVEGEFGIEIHDGDLSIDLVKSFSQLEAYINSRLEVAQAKP